jgi:hypothetical protein
MEYFGWIKALMVTGAVAFGDRVWWRRGRWLIG